LRAEWAGIEAAWSAVPTLDQCDDVRSRIARYHLAEEFCHVRLFGEMFRICHLDRVECRASCAGFTLPSRVFPRLFWERRPSSQNSLGVAFYFHLKRLLDEVFADEPEALGQLQRLLEVITIDELSHIGQRRNYLGAADCCRP
jgi:hypothetical protein